jgi:hypothetical protein
MAAIGIRTPIGRHVEGSIWPSAFCGRLRFRARCCKWKCSAGGRFRKTCVRAHLRKPPNVGQQKSTPLQYDDPVQWRPRRFNRQADWLCNVALDAKSSEDSSIQTSDPTQACILTGKCTPTGDVDTRALQPSAGLFTQWLESAVRGTSLPLHLDFNGFTGTMRHLSWKQWR